MSFCWNEAFEINHESAQLTGQGAERNHSPGKCSGERSTKHSQAALL